MNGEAHHAASDLEVARCFTTGLLLEAISQPKPGLVDRIKRLKELDLFKLSASAVSLHPFFAESSRLGRRGRTRNRLGKLILEAVGVTLRVQRGGNTHLGSVLLTMPLAAGAGSLVGEAVKPEALRRAAVKALRGLGWLDAVNIFRAISLVGPGGLGRVPFLDVNSSETYDFLRRRRAGPLEALEPYRGRDMVADELLDGYPLLFGRALKTLMETQEDKDEFLETACVNALLSVMASRPDTHIVRRRGLHVARIVQSMAAEVLRLGGAASKEGLKAALELDDYLRRVDARPGSSADILGASIGVLLLTGLRV
ncbi:MAG: triphosphoribosyl-dephospho-CoA synthase [Nitrososphaerota archaeon]|nr:triphosphoribosyl-dephospho-CoA synthase [Candidatus Calditenuaceae archaeon]MDW8073119.1 triphosphoribosyl-dephospho-CoA synthase [Nitrososphaerota archaeon]